MLINLKIVQLVAFTQRVNRYDLYSTLYFAAVGVANRRNRQTITPHRALSATKYNALYRPFNYGF